MVVDPRTNPEGPTGAAVDPVPKSRAAAEPDGSVDPRLSIPQLPPGLVTRHRLLDALDEAVVLPGLTLVTAGPGSGKTVLLTEWARRRSQPTAWLALGKIDNHWVPFWSLVIRAVQGTQTVTDTLAPLAWAARDVPGLLDTLFRDETQRGSPLVLVLDDAHVLTDPDILEGLDRIARRWTHRARLVMAARSIPLLPIHQSRLAGQLHELRATDLAMTDDETKQLVRAHGVELTPADFDVLTARTEGWAGGLRLAALRMQSESHPSDFLAGLAMDSGSAGEYLVAEVLALLPDHVRRLLVQTSRLDVVTGESAEAITGLDGCAEALVELARTNSFVVPLDAAHTTFRYHPLLREVLQYLDRRESAQSRQQLNQRATAWFRSQGDTSSALQWAVSGGDPARINAVLAHGLVHAFVDDRAARVAMANTAVRPLGPYASLEEKADFETATLVVVALSETSAAAAVETLRSADVALPEGLTPRARLNRDLALVLLTNQAGSHDELDRRLDLMLAQDLTPAAGGAAGLRTMLMLLRPRRRFLGGHAGGVAELLAEALAEAQREEAVRVEVQVLCVQALIHATIRVGAARETIARANALLASHRDLTRPAELDLAVAICALAEADLPAMEASMSRAIAAGPLYADADVAASVALFQGMYLRACGRFTEAQAWLTSPVLAGSSVRMLAVRRDCELANIELSLGRPQRALSLVRPYDGTEVAVTAAVVTARALVALGDLAGARARLAAVRTQPSPQVSRATLVEAMLCDGHIAMVEDDEPLAMTYLDRARDLAGSDLVILFMPFTPVFAPMLARHPLLAASWPDRERLAEEAAPPAARRPVGGRFTEPLTERERAVLRLLTTTMSTAEMAGDLCLSVNTVKTHLAAIYRKLGVARRREAVLRAREFELI